MMKDEEPPVRVNMDGDTASYVLYIDRMINYLLLAKDINSKKYLDIDINAIHAILIEARKVFCSEPMLLRISAPTNICGDIHGQYNDLLKLLEIGGLPPKTNYLFLGDYVDRAFNSIETVCLLFCFKIKFPKRVYLIRGNHESTSINRIYGFYDECKRRYNVRLWKYFGDVFNCLPVAALVSHRVFCVHGGLSRTDIEELAEINKIKRPCEIPEEGLLCDLLWSDPGQHVGFRDNDRGVSYTFGNDVVASFLKKHDLDLICRGHQVVEDGYLFSTKRSLVTLFSAPNYCGEFDNAAAMMTIDDNLLCSFHVLKSHKEKRKDNTGNLADHLTLT